MRNYLPTAFLLLSVMQSVSVVAQDKELGVSCDEVRVGTIYFGPVSKGGRNGFGATFEIDSDKFESIEQVAAACDQHHFNWQQQVLSAVHLPVDPGGNPLTPPFNDPPPGGYGNNPATPANDTLWADGLPWYWNEGPTPNPLPPGYKPGFHLSDKTGQFSVSFEDFPAWPDGTQIIRFRTRLVSVFEDGRFHKYHGGWEWTWSSTGQGQVGSFQALPEPVVWSYLVLGFGVVGVGIRRGRRQATASRKGLAPEPAAE